VQPPCPMVPSLLPEEQEQANQIVKLDLLHR
jgi:hypothetical protein